MYKPNFMTKIGVGINNLGNNQLSYNFVNSANQIMAKRYDVDIIGFWLNMVTPISLPYFSTMNFVEGFGYKGTFIATDAMMAKQGLSLVGPKRMIYYVWDLEWLRGRQQYEVFAEIFQNPRLELITRNQDHKKIVEDVFNVSVKETINNCDMLKFVEYVEGTNDGEKKTA